MIEIYCDGSSRGNPGDGGFGVAVIKNNQLLEAYGKQYENITNNQGELMGLIWALYLATNDYKNEKVVIYSDSRYCVSTFNEWIRGWARNNWINSKKEQVKNIDLMKIIYNYAIIEFPNFAVERVPGHAGVLGNEIADALASKNQAKLAKIFDEHKDLCVFGKIFDFS